MRMYLAREPGGMFRLCELPPVRMKSFWKPVNHGYFNIDSKFGSIIFPELSFDDALLEIDVDFGIGDEWFICHDLSGTYRICKSEPKFYSIYNNKVKHLCEFWDSKEQFTCEKQFGDELFGIQDHTKYMKILLKISLK